MKKLITGYLFDADQARVTLLNYSGIGLENLLLITNVSQNQIIYNFADQNAGGSVYNYNTFQLEYATSGVMNSSDKLQIFYDVSNERTDLASGRATGYFTGVGFTGYLYAPVYPIDIQSVGGRAVDLAVSGFYPNYQVNDPVAFNFDKDAGAVLGLQADLDKDIDSVTNFQAGFSSVSNYTTGILTPFEATGSAPIPISGNANRITLYGQNMGISLLYVKYGAGASSSSFNTVLYPGTVALDGRGEKMTDDLYKGDISVNVASGQSGIYLFWEGI